MMAVVSVVACHNALRAATSPTRVTMLAKKRKHRAAPPSPGGRGYLQILLGKMSREGGEYGLIELFALQIAEQDHRHLLGLEPGGGQLYDLIVGDGVDSGG